jgi:hypothetical protein
MTDQHLEDQWDAYNKRGRPESDVTDDMVRDALIKDLSVVSKMEVEEYTLYQKWCEVHHKYPTKNVGTLFGPENILKDPNQGYIIQGIKDNIWIPESMDDYLKLEPRLIYTDDSGFDTVQDLHGRCRWKRKRNKDLPETWSTMRNFTSTMKNNSNIGRNLNFMVQDNVTGKYLGLICISSDFLDLTPRDKFIGWDREKKTQGHMINHTAIGSTIVPLQPLGYNYVGGKLLALLCLSDEVQNLWKKQYGDTLIGVTTTSLYGKNKMGGLSQYDRLKHWKKMGFSAGSVAYEPTKPTIALMLAWLEKNHTRKYFEWYHAKKTSGQPYKRDHRNRSYALVYSQLKIPKELTHSAHARGIYFSNLYTNGPAFLRGEIGHSQLEKGFPTDYEYLTELWKNKYAAKRIKSLSEQDRVSSETLFYDSLIYMNWEETREKYLPQVGR